MRRDWEADVILMSNTVFTGLKKEPEAASIAIKGNRIKAVGPKDEISSFIGTETKVYDFGDQLIMPGLHDFHIHLMMGSIEMDSVNLLDAKSQEEALEMVRTFAENRPEEEWILGFAWDNENWGNPKLPHRFSLDMVVKDRPVILSHVECHHAWVNSKALEMMGITKHTEDPPFGEFAKDSTGELTGIAYEHAMILMYEGAFSSYSEDKKVTLLRNFFQAAAASGVTSVNDVYMPQRESLDEFPILKQMEENGELTARVHFSPPLNGDLEKARHIKETYFTEKIQFSGLKQFVDGVLGSRTASLLEPYSDKRETRGTTAFPPDRLNKWIVDADREGFRVRLHAIGDGAVRLALDAYEEARKQNGVRDSRHTIEHIEVIHKEDIKRFHELGVIASMQPYHLSAAEKSVYTARIGKDREELAFPINTLKKAGARLAFGSDFPVVPLNPMLGIFNAITRTDITMDPENVWNQDECITISETLKAYTNGSAYGSFREHELGTLEEGKLADIAVLDRNLFNIPPEEILSAKVILTMMDGKVVYEKSRTGAGIIPVK
ncbi:amidohydrolase [Evansella clarkii]|uniref:amidohydrolase n=1 Tax=Evansella clarkii TaxID=79879 RepID=UPI00099621BA|nr:amidohydrolase [Evansella clarkii]